MHHGVAHVATNLTRQVVGERLTEVAGALPQGVHEPVMAPLTSAASMVLAIGLTSDTRSLMDIRTFADWTDARPGFVEMDLVAHCGWSGAGPFLYTLSMVDVATGSVACAGLRDKRQETGSHALQRLQADLRQPVCRKRVRQRFISRRSMGPNGRRGIKRCLPAGSS